MILCVTLYVGGALLGFDTYDAVCISAHWVVQRGQGTIPCYLHWPGPHTPFQHAC